MQGWWPGARPGLRVSGSLQPAQRKSCIAGKEGVVFPFHRLQGRTRAVGHLGRAVQRNPFQLVNRLTGGRDVASASRFARGQRSIPEVAGFVFHDVPFQVCV
jgi:hypothetical protein